MVVDPVSGDSICNGIDGKGCGMVMLDHSVDHGAEKRNFEGEEVCILYRRHAASTCVMSAG